MPDTSGNIFLKSKQLLLSNYKNILIVGVKEEFTHVIAKIIQNKLSQKQFGGFIECDIRETKDEGRFSFSDPNIFALYIDYIKTYFTIEETLFVYIFEENTVLGGSQGAEEESISKAIDKFDGIQIIDAKTLTEILRA